MLFHDLELCRFLSILASSEGKCGPQVTWWNSLAPDRAGRSDDQFQFSLLIFGGDRIANNRRSEAALRADTELGSR